MTNFEKACRLIVILVLLTLAAGYVHFTLSVAASMRAQAAAIHAQTERALAEP